MPHGFFRRSLAVTLSVLVAGSGQAFNRQPKKGLIFLAVVPISVFIAGKCRIIDTFSGLLVWAGFELLFLLWVTVDAAAYGGNSTKERLGFSRARPWYVIAIAVIVINAIGGATNFYQNFALHGLAARVDPSDSMYPTIQAGDRFIVDMRAYKEVLPGRGDIVLFWHYSPGHGPEDYVKRVIAIGGDTVEGRKAGVYLNGKLINEPYAKYNSSQKEYDATRVFGPVRVRSGQFFVMGDNRDSSYDSRYFGTVPLADIEGCPLYLYWSRHLDRLGQTIR